MASCRCTGETVQAYLPPSAACSPVLLLHSDTFPSPPHQTVRDVLRHTAFQCPSSGRMQRVAYAGSTQTEDAEPTEPRRWIPVLPSASYLPMLLASK